MNRNRINDTSLLCITRDDPFLNHFEQAKIFVRAGARLIQLRAKTLSPGELYKQAKATVDFTKHHDCQLIINDHYELVQDIDADGVHLGMTDAPIEHVRGVLSPEKIIGKTIHSMMEARQSLTEEPDYIGLGPYRHSTTKQELCPVLSDDDFFSILEILKPTPVFLIGGLNGDDFSLIQKFSIQGIALCSELFAGVSIQDSIGKLVEKSRTVETPLTIS
ncbi:MAG: thiamine phosphate synthase [Opitutae bacterium]